MYHRVTAKQPNSRMCLVCGLKNDCGIKAAFYELESDQVLALFAPCDQHQGYPGRLHGGIAAAVLDETIGRAIRLRYQDQLWGVTVELRIKLRQPIPLNQTLRAVGRITLDNLRRFEGTGEILLADGTIAAQAWGKYLKQPIERIAEFDVQQQEWRVVNHDDDPTQVDL